MLEILWKVPLQASKGKHINSIKTKTLSDDILNSQPISNIALRDKKLEEQMYQHAKNLEFERQQGSGIF